LITTLSKILFLKDHRGEIRTFNLDKMIEIIHENNPNTSSISRETEGSDFKSKEILFSFLLFHFQ
jgi:hypothetical protein